MQSEEIVQLLKSKFDALTTLLENLPPEKVQASLAPDKWSAGQIAVHLVLSARPVVKSMLLPKTVLAEKFGTRNGTLERTFEDLLADYRQKTQGGVTAPPQFTPEEVKADQKNNLTADLQQVLSELIGVIRQWNEVDLSTYMMPHPALGKLTVREMLYFTAFHTEHHTGQIVGN